MEKEFDLIVAANCPLETRIQRAMQRDGVSREKILERIARQIPLEQNRGKISFFIDTGGTEEETRASVDCLYRILKTHIWPR